VASAASRVVLEQTGSSASLIVGEEELGPAPMGKPNLF
jgi:hypothetical protein